jgi:protein TonB
MTPASAQFANRRLTSRTLVLLAVALIHLGLALLLLLTTRFDAPGQAVRALQAFNIRAPQAAPEAQPEPAKPQQTPLPQPSPRPTAPPIDAPAPLVDLGVLDLSLDIRRLPNRRTETAEASTDTAVAQSPLAYGPSRTRPPSLFGKTLYQAEWVREPTDAELSPYLPARVPPGAWALIACRTVAGYRVEDCQELADSQGGSGLARAIRNAAWQFRVRPPRVDGEYKVGEWVQIRIDFTQPPKDGG